MILGLDFKVLKHQFETHVLKQENNVKLSSVVNKKHSEDCKDDNFK